MTGGNKITFDPKHLEEISKKYGELANMAGQAITDMETAKINILDSYEGEAKDSVIGCCNKIKEHLSLLQNGSNQLISYVNYAIKLSQTSDKKLADGYDAEPEKTSPAGK